MKTKLLRKIRKNITVFERKNGTYRVELWQPGPCYTKIEDYHNYSDVLARVHEFISALTKHYQQKAENNLGYMPQKMVSRKDKIKRIKEEELHQKAKVVY